MEFVSGFRNLAVKKATGKEMTAQIATGFHHSIIVNECKPIENPIANITRSIRQEKMIVFEVLLFKT